MGSTDALDVIWRRMSRPFNLVRAVPALTGIPAPDVAALVTLHLAISDEADELLAELPSMLRNLSGSTTTEIERCVGNMRGTVMWAETLTARANTFGADDVFVCAAPRRTSDTSENRTLVAALDLIARANRALEGESAKFFGPDDLARIEANSLMARSFIRHRALADVRRKRVAPREVHKVSSGRRSKQYASALAMLHRRAEPLRPEELAHLCDERTLSQHRALVLTMAGLQRRGLAVPQFRCAKGELVAGRLRYRNWRQATEAGNHGILLDDVLIDAPVTNSPQDRGAILGDLEERAGARHFCVVASAEDAELAIDIALAGTQWARPSVDA